MEQQQQATQNLAAAAIGLVSESRFKERTQYLEQMLGDEIFAGRQVPFPLGTRLAEDTTLGQLLESMEAALPLTAPTIRLGLKSTFANVDPNTMMSGKVYGYADHPDGDFRIEFHLDRQLDQVENAVTPHYILTFAARQMSGGAPYTIVSFKPGREEWPGMLLSAPKQEVVTEPKPAPDLSQIFLKRSSDPKPAALDKVVKNLPSLDLSTPVQMNKEAYSFAEGGIVQPFVASGTVGRAKQEDGDGTMSLYAPSPERLEAMGQPADQRSVAEMIHDLLSRGHRMPTPFQELTGNKLKAEVSDIEQVKFFLDEVFRAGNLWLYDQLVTALKAEKHGSIDSRQTIFLLTITGNWQEHRGPINAVVKMKAYWASDKERSNELFRISGPMAL